MPRLMKIAGELNIENQKSQLVFILKHLYDMFIERDIEYLEVNPIVLTYDDKLCVNHTKIKIDKKKK